MSKQTNPIRTVLLRLDNNFTNIDEVYNDEKNKWHRENKDQSELDFMDAFDFTEGYDIDTIDKSLFTEIKLANLSKLSTYLGKNRGKIKRTLEDYYNYYLKTKRFGFVFMKQYKKNEFKEFKDPLEDYKLKYNYIFAKLAKDGKIEFKNDFCDQLKKLNDLQEHSKFKEVISDTIKIIEDEYLKPKKEHQQSNEDKPDEVKIKHNHIFRNNAFEVWQSMYNSFEINESSRTDVKFMYEVMKKDGLIFETVNQKIFLDWISKTYQIVIQKTSNYSKTPIRNNTYSNAKQLYKA